MIEQRRRALPRALRALGGTRRALANMDEHWSIEHLGDARMPYRLPGPICTILTNWKIDVGTLCRSPSAAPVPIGLGQSTSQPTKNTTATANTGQALDLTGFDYKRLTTGYPSEARDIVNIAQRKGIDARFLAAVRLAENGAKGREFGVLSIPAPEWSDQANIAANTIAHRLNTYSSSTNKPPSDSTGRLTNDFIKYFAYGDGGNTYGGWAPLGSNNDPDNLNANWLQNVIAYYSKIDVVYK